MAAQVLVDRVTVGNQAANSWQDLKSPRPPAGTDVKVHLNIRGVAPDKIKTALQSLHGSGQIAGAYVSITGIECWVVVSRQDTFRLKKPGNPGLQELTSTVREKVLAQLTA